MIALSEYADMINKRLSELLCKTDGFAWGNIPGPLCEAMRYSLLAGGKRLRPAMLLESCRMLGGSIDEAMDYACAIEMIHTYSLIHDDLPGMDNDDLRRGKPTNHVVFGEGQAILAGDGLLNLAFETMLSAAKANMQAAKRHILAAAEIAEGAGVTGMIAGQCADLYAEKQETASLELLNYIQLGKTMAMFKGAVRAGAQLAGASEAALNALTAYAKAFGVLFQISDDVLDYTADAEKFGKSKGKDLRDGKLTEVSATSLEKAQQRVKELAGQAVDALNVFNGKAEFFVHLTKAMAERTY